MPLENGQSTLFNTTHLLLHPSQQKLDNSEALCHPSQVWPLLVILLA
jgi:hypothetical protein